MKSEDLKKAKEKLERQKLIRKYNPETLALPELKSIITNYNVEEAFQARQLKKAATKFNKEAGKLLTVQQHKEYLMQIYDKRMNIN